MTEKELQHTRIVVVRENVLEKRKEKGEKISAHPKQVDNVDKLYLGFQLAPHPERNLVVDTSKLHRPPERLAAGRGIIQNVGRRGR